MELNNNRISRYQLFCLGFLGLLSPIIRLIPNTIVGVSGSFGLYSLGLSLLPLSILFLVFHKAIKHFNVSEGFSNMIKTAFGNGLGGILLGLFVLWLIFYIAFALNSTALRYTTTAYTSTNPAYFVIALLLLAVLVNLKPLKNLARSSEILFPLLFIVLAFIFIFAVFHIDTKFLEKPIKEDFSGILKGSFLIANVLSLSVYVGFLEGKIKEPAKAKRTMFLWLSFMALVVALLCLTTIGSFGKTLTEDLNHPFFVLVSNISLFNVISRLEALVLALWFITDFILVSLMLFICSNISKEVFGGRDSKKFSTIVPLVLGVLIFVTSLIIGDDSSRINTLSTNVIPYVNVAFTFGLLPISALVFLRRVL